MLTDEHQFFYDDYFIGYLYENGCVEMSELPKVFEEYGKFGQEFISTILTNCSFLKNGYINFNENTQLFSITELGIEAIKRS